MNIQPTTDEELTVLKNWDFNTLSKQVALELIARIEAAEARVAQMIETLGSRELLELLACAEHDRWSGWMEYQDRALPEKRADWPRKAAMTYAELTNVEQESDRIEARKTLATIRAALSANDAQAGTLWQAQMIADLLKSMTSGQGDASLSAEWDSATGDPEFSVDARWERDGEILMRRGLTESEFIALIMALKGEPK